ncbi:MAG: hypothetical protein M0Z56_04660 [Desulfobacteraceae bacterium]|nr:hypothetical protein [Desulfobacteraceae bacterium]
MPQKCLFLKILLILYLFFEAGQALAHAQTAPAPQTFLPETRFEFPPVFEGQTVRHAFVIANRGTAPLDIADVRTG